MADLMAKRLTVGQIALLAPLAVGGLVAARYFGAKKVGAAERLANALIDTGRLTGATVYSSSSPETALAECAAYLINVSVGASSGMGRAGGAEDPIGHSRSVRHPYTHVSATVLTESTGSTQVLTYSVDLPDGGAVRGTRTVRPQRLSGLTMARPTPDTVQISLGDDYSAQLESEFEATDYLITGKNQVFGTATLRDNRGNVGRLNVGRDGVISGTITRDARVVGRFDGAAATGVNFQRYQIPPEQP